MRAGRLRDAASVGRMARVRFGHRDSAPPRPAAARQGAWRAGCAVLAVAGLAACAQRPAEVRVGFDATRVTSVASRGLADRATRRRVTPDDPVRVASISKLAVGLVVMRLVERGTLDLDRDVSDWLGWRLRNPAFPQVPVTLRLLLSHRSSLTDAADYAVPLGDSVRARTGDARAWDAMHAPGGFFRYANLNFPVVAGVIEKATGERFDRVMMRELFVPLRLDACFNWSGCTSGRIARHVVLYDGVTGAVRTDDLKARAPVCPVNVAPGNACDLAGYRPGDNGALFSPQGGMRISMRDLARLGQVLLRRGEGLLKPESVAAMTAPAWIFDGSNGDTSGGFYCRYGLAVQLLPTRAAGCRDDLFRDGAERVGHAGEAYGLRSGLWLDMAGGRGLAFFASAVPDSGAEGRASAYTAAEERLARGR